MGKEVMGYKDVRGHWVIEPLYDVCFPFRCGLAPVSLEGKRGALLPDGQWRIPPRYDFLRPFCDGWAPMRMEDRWGMVSSEGAEIWPTGATLVDYAGEGIFNCRVGDTWGYYEPTQGWVVAPRFSSASHFSDGVALVREGERSFYIQRDGALVLEGQDFFTGSSCGLMPFLANGKVGFMDRHGEVRIWPKFDSVGIFSEDRAFAFQAKSNRYALISKQGEELTDYRFCETGMFHEGHCCLKIGGGEAMYIDANGDRVSREVYYGGERFSEGKAIVKATRKTAVVVDKYFRELLRENVDESFYFGFYEGLLPTKLLKG